jgi:hypothetical protein
MQNANWRNDPGQSRRMRKYSRQGPTWSVHWREDARDLHDVIEVVCECLASGAGDVRLTFPGRARVEQHGSR